AFSVQRFVGRFLPRAARAALALPWADFHCHLRCGNANSVTVGLMAYRSLRECIADLERTKQLVRLDAEIDARLEVAEIQRRVYAAGGPAILYTRVKGCRFPMVSNLFGTIERARFLFRDTLDAVRHLIELKVDAASFWKNPWRYRDVPRVLWHMRPKFV